MPLAAVEKYAGPPLAERAWTVERAQDAVIRPGERTLSAVMGAEAASRGAEPDSMAWDSWRRPDGRWAVVATFDASGSSRSATWIFDPRSKAVIADDAEASRLATEDVVIPLRPGRRHHTQIIPTGTRDSDRSELRGAVTDQGFDAEPVVTKHTDDSDGEDIEVDDVVAEVIEIAEAPSAEQASTEEAARAEAVQEALDVPAETPRKSKRGRRASVPSWDEILFGSQGDD
jgi:hypothetical protein